MFGAGGTDITDPKCGTSFYRNWLNKKRKEADDKTVEPKESEESIKKRAERFNFEKERIMGRRVLRPENVGKQWQTKIK